MPKFDAKRLAKTAGGDPAELCINIVQGSGSATVALAGSGPRDGLVSVLENTGGSAWLDHTAVASLVAGGSISPGANVGSNQLIVTWYKFEG